MENKDKKMIYDNDPWLMPYKDAIDARHDRILAERKRIAGEGPLAEHVARFPVPVFTAIGHDQDVHICDMVAWTSVKTPTALADAFIGMYAAEDNAIASYAGRLKLAFLGKINAMESRIRLLEARITGADPRNILKRGYVLTVDSAGLVIKGVAGRKPGDRIRLMYHDGNLGCAVSEVEEKEYGGKE